MQEGIDADGLQFALAWDDAARHFLSGMFADPVAGYDIGSQLGLTAEHFPRRELARIADFLCVAAQLNIRPTIAGIIEAARADGQPIYNGNPADLAWLDALCYGSAANVAYYAKVLRDFAARRRLADLCRKVYVECLGVTTLDDCLDSIEADLRGLRTEVRAVA